MAVCLISEFIGDLRMEDKKGQHRKYLILLSTGSLTMCYLFFFFPLEKGNFSLETISITIFIYSRLQKHILLQSSWLLWFALWKFNIYLISIQFILMWLQPFFPPPLWQIVEMNPGCPIWMLKASQLYGMTKESKKDIFVTIATIKLFL